MSFLKQSLFRIACGFFPFFPRYWPLFCMTHSIPWDTSWSSPTHGRKDAGLIQQACIYAKRKYLTQIFLVIVYPALILDPRRCFYTLSKLVFRNEMIQIDVRCVLGEPAVIVLFRSEVNYPLQECKVERITDLPAIFIHGEFVQDYFPLCLVHWR